jgi:hypothetical protein
MADARLQAELLESRAELERLRGSMLVGDPTLHKDVLDCLNTKMDRVRFRSYLEEFLSSVEAAMRIRRWQDSDKREITALKLSGSAKMFYQGCTELHEVDAA